MTDGPQRILIGKPNGAVADFEGVIASMDYTMEHGMAGEINLRIMPTESLWNEPAVGPVDDDVAMFPGPIVKPLGLHPFVYGFAFLLLLWACMASEKWIGWVIG